MIINENEVWHGTSNKPETMRDAETIDPAYFRGSLRCGDVSTPCRPAHGGACGDVEIRRRFALSGSAP